MSSPSIGILAGTLILLVIICGCIGIPESEGPVVTRVTLATPFPTIPPQAGPSGVTWYLASLTNGDAPVRIIPGTMVTAFFDGHDTVSGTTGCNNYTAEYSGNSTGIVISPPLLTWMNCEFPSGIMTQEILYLKALTNASTYSIMEDLLIVNDSRGKTIMIFKSVPTGKGVPQPLIGTVWYLNSFSDPSGNIRTPGRLTTITLLFHPDGNTYGNAGCNDYVSSYQVGEGDTISLSDPGITRQFCGIGGVMDLETTYLAILPQMKMYKITGNELTLSDGTGKITMLYDTNPL